MRVIWKVHLAKVTRALEQLARAGIGADTLLKSSGIDHPMFGLSQPKHGKDDLAWIAAPRTLLFGRGPGGARHTQRDGAKGRRKGTAQRVGAKGWRKGPVARAGLSWMFREAADRGSGCGDPGEEGLDLVTQFADGVIHIAGRPVDLAGRGFGLADGLRHPADGLDHRLGAF